MPSREDMVKLQKKYYLRIDKYEASDLCAVFMLSSVIYASLLVMSQYGPNMLQSEMIQYTRCQSLLQMPEKSEQFQWGSYNCAFCHNFQNQEIDVFSLRLRVYISDKGNVSQLQGKDLEVFQSVLGDLDQNETKNCQVYAHESKSFIYPRIPEKKDVSEGSSIKYKVYQNQVQKKVQFTCSVDKSERQICESGFLSSLVKENQGYSFLMRIDFDQFLDQVDKVRLELVYENTLFGGYQRYFIILFFVTNLGFFFYAKNILRKFPSSQQIKIHYWIHVLIVLVFFYNDPLEFFLGKGGFLGKNKFLGYLRTISEKSFVCVLLLFWLDIFQLSYRIKNFQSLMSGKINQFKLALIMFYIIPSIINEAVKDSLFEEEQAQELPFLLRSGKFQLMVLSIYGAVFYYLSFQFLRNSFQAKNLGEELASKGHHNVLVRLSIITFTVFFTLQFFSQEISIFSIYSIKCLLNIYLYLVIHLYLPVGQENQFQEQEYEFEGQEKKLEIEIEMGSQQNVSMDQERQDFKREQEEDEEEENQNQNLTSQQRIQMAIDQIKKEKEDKKKKEEEKKKNKNINLIDQEENEEENLAELRNRNRNQEQEKYEEDLEDEEKEQEELEVEFDDDMMKDISDEEQQENSFRNERFNAAENLEGNQRQQRKFSENDSD